ncbi:MAG: hypothetical protein ACAH65_12955 [Chloroflexota bacterium]
MSVPSANSPAPDSGDRPPETVVRRLAEPPSARYAQAVAGADDPAGLRRRGSRGPILRATAIAAGGAGLLFVVGGLLSTTAGLLFIAAVTGAGAGLTLAGLAAPATSGPAGEEIAAARSTVLRAAVALAVSAVVVAAIATWLFARSEGGVLDIVDYLWSTFGLLVPGEVLVAAVGAAWGATAGPVSRS